MGPYTDEQLQAVGEFIKLANEEIHRHGYDTPVATEIIRTAYAKLTRGEVSDQGIAYADAQDVEDFTTGPGTMADARYALARAYDAGHAIGRETGRREGYESGHASGLATIHMATIGQQQI